MQEFKRCINIRVIWLTAVLLLVNGIILVNNYADSDGVYCIYNELIRNTLDCEEALTQTEKAEQAWIEYCSEHNLDMRGEQEYNPEEISAAKNARELLVTQTEYLDGLVKLVQEKKDKSQQIIETGLYKRNSFGFNNLVKTMKDIEKIHFLNLQISNGAWLETLLNYEYIQIFVILLLLVIVYDFFNERNTGLYYIIHSSKNGRSVFFIKRCIILIGCSIAFNLLFYTESVLVLLHIYGGYEGINMPALTDKEMFLTSGNCTRLEFLCAMVIISILCSSALAFLLWFILSLFKNPNIGIFSFLIICGVEMLLYVFIPQKSFLRMLHYMNVYYLFYPCEILRYHNWGYSAFVVRISTSTCVLAVLILLVSMIINGYNYERQYFTGRQNRIEMLLTRCFEAVIKQFTYVPLFIKELYKILVSQKAVIILGVLLYLVTCINTGPQPMYDLMQSYMSGYYDEAAGLAYGEKLEMIYEKYLDDYNYTIDGLDLTKENERNIYQYRTNGINNIRYNIDYLKRAKEKNVSAEVVNPHEYNMAFFTQEREKQMLMVLINILAAISIFCGFISFEKKNNMYSMAFACKRRRFWLAEKFTAGVVLLAIFEGVSYIIYFDKIMHTYKLEQLSSPLKSIPFFWNFPVNPSIGAFVVYYLIMIFIFLCAMGIIVSCLSIVFSWSKCYLAGLVIIIPNLLFLLGFKNLESLSITKYVAFLPCYYEGGVSLIICIVIYAFFTLIGIYLGILFWRRIKGHT